jgi:hypothetical protein
MNFCLRFLHFFHENLVPLFQKTVIGRGIANSFSNPKIVKVIGAPKSLFLQGEVKYLVIHELRPGQGVIMEFEL